MSRLPAPFGTDNQDPFTTKIVGGRTVLSPIDHAGDERRDVAPVSGFPSGSDSIPTGIENTSCPALGLGKENRHDREKLSDSSVTFLPHVSGRLMGDSPRTTTAAIGVNKGTQHTVLPPIGSRSKLLPDSPDAINSADIAAPHAPNQRNARGLDDLASRCDNLLDHGQLTDLSRELGLVLTTKSGLLTEDRFSSLVNEHSPCLDGPALTWLVKQCKYCNSANSTAPAMVDCKKVNTLLEQALAVLSPLSMMSTSAPFPEAPFTEPQSMPPHTSCGRPVRHPRLKALTQQHSSSEPSLLFVGKRPESHSSSGTLPVPIVRRELDSDDPLNISEALQHGHKQKELQHRQSSAMLLRQRHDAKLLVAIERDWMASGCVSLDINAFQKALGEFDPGRSGKITTAQVSEDY